MPRIPTKGAQGEPKGSMSNWNKNTTLIERLHLVGSHYWVYYELCGVALGDFPDDGVPVIMDVIRAIRYEFGLGLPEAYAVWRGRKIDV